ncbi:head maturation protease, ClpP-related [Paenibacillus harenae]|uniref:ATP-dependent Clp protease proteolytic subunit n=1 Tax=Paenibacillus harenae TaxID=306543 RepID=A0ABT9U3Z4_PAEHA|nr:head maturation protease, ClpP-related [Paenibacillus harenae]MDQ0114366.1 ATP-dependent Clp endopeptidase proteolytic subunit ClpP [Paenibacillus harenae]
MSQANKSKMMKPNPIFNAKKVSNSSAELTIYAPIEDEESWWYDSVSPKGVMRALKNMGNVDEVIVRINSPGGSVFAGLAIYQYLKDHKAKVTVKVDGLAASAASVIMMAGDTIIMGTGAMVMAHNPWTIAMGEAKDFRETADMLDQVQKSIISVYEERTGKTGDDLKAMMDATTWMTADEAVAMGFADEIDRKTKVSASIKNGIATFNNQRFDLRAFASIPVLPEDTEDDEEEPATEPPPVSGEGDEDVKDLEELKSKHPDIYKAALQAGIQAGIKDERDRITELNALADAPGAAEIVAKAIADGGSAAQAAMDIVKASKERLTEEGQRRARDAQNSGLDKVPPDEAPETPTAEATAQAEADAIVAEMKKLKGGR